MIADEIKELMNAQPFRPVRIVLGNHQSFIVAHTDYLMISPDKQTVLLYDKQGRLFAKYRPATSHSGPLPGRSELEGMSFGNDHLTLFHAIRCKGERVGTIYIESDLQEMRERFQQYARIVFLIALASSLITYLLSMVLQRIISRPIFHLSA